MSISILNFLLLISGQALSQSIDCIIITRRAIPDEDGRISTWGVRCPENYSAVSCGYRTDPVTTTETSGSYSFVSSSSGKLECNVRTFENIVTIGYARCCNLQPYNISCSSNFAFESEGNIAGERFINDTIQEIGCSDGAQLFDCQQAGYHIFGMLPVYSYDRGLLGTYPLNSTEPPPEGSFDLDNTCTSHRTSSYDPSGVLQPNTAQTAVRLQSIARYAVCCDAITADFSFQCVGVSSGPMYWDGNHTFTLQQQCPADYTLFSCQGFSPFNLVNGAYIDNSTDPDQCVVQRVNDMNDTHYSVATAICCKAVTPSPTSNPTEMTMNPTIDPTDSSSSSSDSDSDSGTSDSSDSQYALRMNDERNEMNVWDVMNLDDDDQDDDIDYEDDKHENENMVIKYRLSLSFQETICFVIFCCMMTMFGWFFVMFKSAQNGYKNN